MGAVTVRSCHLKAFHILSNAPHAKLQNGKTRSSPQTGPTLSQSTQSKNRVIAESLDSIARSNLPARVLATRTQRTMSFCGPSGFWEGGFTVGVCHWPSFASAGTHSPSDLFDFGFDWGLAGPLVKDVFSREACSDVDNNRLGNNGARKPPRFFDVFTASHLVFIVGRQTALSVMLDLAPYISQVHEALEKADKENLDAVIPPCPPLWDSVRKGLFLAVKQGTVTLIRWMSDNLVYISLPVKIATELLKDARKEITGLFENGASALQLTTGIYSTMLTTYCTWALAEFTVSMGLEIYAMGKDKCTCEAILSKAQQHAYRCGVLLFTDPIGGVIGGISTASVVGSERAWMGVMIGFNMLDLFMASSVI